MINDIKAVIRKMEIKEMNSLDTTDEMGCILTTFCSVFPYDEMEEVQEPKIVKHSLVKCRESFMAYKEALQTLTDNFEKWKECDDTCKSRLSIYYDTYYKNCMKAYAGFEEVVSDFYCDLLDYGDFVAEVHIPELEKQFFLPFNVLEQITLIYCFEYSIGCLKKATRFIEEALLEGNKGMCMTLAPYIHGCCTNIDFRITKENSLRHAITQTD